MAEVKTELANIVRDTTNGALLNKDNAALMAYKKTKKSLSEMEEMKTKVNNIEKEFSEVKSLLNAILEKL
jgi:predicted transcriptional regulator